MPTFFEGYKKELEVSDLYETLTEHKSSRLGDRIEAAWKTEGEKAAKSKRKPSLRRVLIKTFGIEFIIYGIVLAFTEIFIRYVEPYFYIKHYSQATSYF